MRRTQGRLWLSWEQRQLCWWRSQDPALRFGGLGGKECGWNRKISNPIGWAEKSALWTEKKKVTITREKPKNRSQIYIKALWNCLIVSLNCLSQLCNYMQNIPPSVPLGQEFVSVDWHTGHPGGKEALVETKASEKQASKHQQRKCCFTKCGYKCEACKVVFKFAQGPCGVNLIVPVLQTRRERSLIICGLFDQSASLSSEPRPVFLISPYP